MKVSITAVSLTAILSASFLFAVSAPAETIEPFKYFNVYSLGDINYRGSDFEGTAGAAGNVNVSSFSLGVKSANKYALHAGGKVKLGSGSYHGSIEAAGDTELANLIVYGDVNSGGKIWNSGGGQIRGSLNAQNVQTNQNMTVYGQKNSGVPYSPYVNLGAVSSYFQTFSSGIAQQSQYVKVFNNYYGALQADLFSGINVINLDYSYLNNAHTFNVNGPADAIFYINVTGTDAVLNSTTWKYTGGILPSDILLNYYEAESLYLSGGNYVNILAPFADTTFSSGLITGNLIVGDLDGKGQVNLGHFDHGTPMAEPVPEPSTLLLTGIGALSFFLIRKKRVDLMRKGAGY